MIKAFDFRAGQVIAKKYQVVAQLGAGWEGEVYLTKEVETGIDRAAKFFFPHRNRDNGTAKGYAMKLHKVRESPVVIQYHNQEKIRYENTDVTCLISEYVQGEQLSEFVAKQPESRLHPFEALHVLHAIARGVESIHRVNEYHGDLHTGNILVTRRGMSFEVKLFDLYDWKDSTRENMKKDICDLVRVFFDCLGGPSYYNQLPAEIKWICAGLKRSLILKRFKTVTHLIKHIEAFQWS
jgi:serine/threonine protein kinase